MKKTVSFVKGGSGGVTAKVTLPKEFLEALKISKGDEVDITLENGKIIIKKVEKDIYVNEVLKKDFDCCNKVLKKYNITNELKKECLDILALEKEFNLDEVKNKEKSSYINGFYEGSMVFISRLLDKKLKDTINARHDMFEAEEALNRLYKIENINEEVFADEYDIEIVKTYVAYCSAEDTNEIAIIKRKDVKDKEFEYVFINLDTLEYELDYKPSNKELELFDNE